jgi:hypothetical protein
MDMAIARRGYGVYAGGPAACAGAEAAKAVQLETNSRALDNSTAVAARRRRKYPREPTVRRSLLAAGSVGGGWGDTEAWGRL